MNRFVREAIFPVGARTSSSTAWILLFLRLGIGILMMVHGVQKIMAYDTLVNSFPDPIGLGGGVSLSLAIFAEFLCSLGVITGLFFRLALIPLIFTMCVASFLVMGSAPWAAQELPVIYLLIYVLLFVTGPGVYSLDALIGNFKCGRIISLGRECDEFYVAGDPLPSQRNKK